MEEFAAEYRARLNRAFDKLECARQIAREISGLTYTVSGEKLSTNDRQHLVSLIPERDPRTGNKIIKSDDHRAFLQAVSLLQSLVES